MKKQPKLIVANWKLNPMTPAEAKKLSGRIERRSKHTAVICPPPVLLPFCSYPRLGSQDCFWETRGHYTGQVSVEQLKALKVKYCIIGHSERRATGDTDVFINGKVRACLAANIIPILCIGAGTTPDEDDLAVVDVLKGQLEHGLAGLDASEVIVAYEPTWAISNGDAMTHRTPTPEHAEHIALYISSRFGVSQVLYGGSVNVRNAAGFLAPDAISGLLVGAESLVPSHFNAIINI